MAETTTTQTNDTDRYQSLLELELHLDEDQLQEVFNRTEDECDFTEGRYRFIAAAVIDETLADELGDDDYILGCFEANFIAGSTGWPVELVEAAQMFDEGRTKLGEAISRSRERLEKLAKEYAAAASYGHHFANYDHDTHEFEGKDGGDWYAFRVD